MKKIVSIMLIVIMALSVTACGKKESVAIDAPQSKDEVGLWAMDDLYLDVDSMKAAYEADELEWEEMSEEEIKNYENFYKTFMGSLYMEFKEDGTGILNFYVPESEKDEDWDDTNTASSFTYENGAVKYSDEESQDEPAFTYTIEDNKLKISEDGLVMVFVKINSLEEIENSEFWKSLKELEEQMYASYEDLEYEEDIVEDTLEEIVEEDSNN